MKKVWINKKLFDMDKARVSIFDRGFMYGDGVFESMRSYAGVVSKIDEHLGRLARSLKTTGIKSPYSNSYLKKEIYRLLGVNNLKNAYIRLTITRGEGRFGVEHKDVFKPSVVIIAKEFDRYPDWMFEKGISAHIVSTRQNDLSPLAGVKSLNYLNYIMARFEAKKSGCEEAIILNTKGRIVEAVTSNIFIVKRNAIVTPLITDGALPGVTRAVIIKIAKKLGFRVIEKSLSPKELMNSDEIFLTNSLAEVLPVTKIDRKPIGAGIPGHVTNLLRISYQNQIK
ncbi:MAG: aminodeoxychorismate lyase [Candidatus Omnitrophica bacterium]|nr:aminodeoxychorismate lyase [Candidatus Omnitrophota bacterium]